jgi:hypothetical protein
VGIDVAIMQFIQWAVKSGLVPAGTAVLLAVFCLLVIWMVKTFTKSTNEVIVALKESHTETCLALKSQVEMQTTHIASCERRYEQLRSDMGDVQNQVAETHKDLWKEVLTQLRKITG